ncbi:DUF1800 domain-containing protein [Nocardioides sp.]|uniref:DUF1800 domain-containing protein n=1 Tax=Nocardioides sp. TaxID=35761 RepID=UPI00286A7577|nr:DUF1800 domain-containing protein [Nocardioides sp.]
MPVPTPVLPTADRHVVGRFSGGPTPQLTAEVLRAGGALAWFDRQVDAGAPSAGADAFADWWPDLHLAPSAVWQRHITDVRGGHRVTEDYRKQLMLRRILSPLQVLEVMTDFWENHLHVTTAQVGTMFPWRADYGRVIRKHALGRFDVMLAEAITHPAMLTYLNGSGSTASHPNENLGRELLELHTVGVGSFTEDDVKGAARILTGWRVQLEPRWSSVFVARDHWLGQVLVKDFLDLNVLSSASTLTARFLRHLAHHPDTATHLAHKLAVKFVRDDPSPALVARLAKVYLDEDTRIAPVLKALVRDPEFRQATGAKLRDPVEDVVATHRVLRTVFAPPSDPDDASAANSIIEAGELLGQSPHLWTRPDGAPQDNAAWASASRAMGSFQVHWSMATASWPTQGITYRPIRSWVPRYPIVFSELVDHLARNLLGRPSDASLLDACVVVTGVRPSASITRTHTVVTRGLPSLLTTVLDSPGHYYR